ncbi:MAG: hypothetical protein PHT75_00015 [Bacilli bacterium]|nr:hypothetical protein [Bacilli bacterium]MDD3304507.1 hypothetical protein [Bacilli bacterium]MDD4053888.1 hypothetical protein [Bacilli bacterium]MDD4411257.1 hypothetical protein [Bacilli bacterium]
MNYVVIKDMIDKELAILDNPAGIYFSLFTIPFWIVGIIIAY